MLTLTMSSDWPKKIGIVGYYGGTNLGDETVVAILIKKLRERYPNAELFGFSLNPASTELRHAIKAFPIRLTSERTSNGPPTYSRADVRPTYGATLKHLLKKRPFLFRPLKVIKNRFYDVPCTILREIAFLRRCFQKLQGFELLVVPGSGPLTDWWGGPWSHPYTLFRWTLLAKMRGAKVIALSIGSERLNTRLGKAFCKWNLSMMDYCSFRDRHSRDTMEAVGLGGEKPVFPDQGFGLPDLFGPDPRDAATTVCNEPDAGLIVGVCPVAKGCCVRPDADGPSYEKYRDNLTTFLLWLIRRGYRISFCHTDEDWDRPLVEQIAYAIRINCPGEDVSNRIIRDRIATTDELVARILRCDLMIASRYHAVVLPFVLRKPVLGISYERKVGDLMSDMGQGDYHLPMDQADVREMIRLFQALEQNRDSIIKHLGEVVSEYRCSLARQYEYVFGRFAGEARRPEGIPRAERNGQAALRSVQNASR